MDVNRDKNQKILQHQKDCNSKDQFFIGVDCGTQSLRVCCVDVTGKVIGRSKQDLETYHRFPFWAEQDAEHWWQAFVEAIREICKDKALAQRIISIGICGTCSTLVPCGFNLKPKGPAILWMDNRAHAEAQELREILKEVDYPVRLSSEQLAPKFLWLTRHRPDHLKGFLVECASWLVFQLTGQLSVSEAITNFTWGILPDQWLHLGQLEDEIKPFLPAIQIPIKSPTSIAGTLKPQLALEFGMKSVQKPITVAVGGNDGLLSAVAAGLIGKIPTTVEVGGTSYVLFLQTRTPPIITPPQYFSCGPDPFEPNSWIMYSSIESAGVFLDWLKGLLKITPDEFNAILKDKRGDIKNGKYHASSVYVDINILGEKIQTPHIKGSTLANLTAATTRAELLQAVIESIAIKAWQRMEHLLSACYPQPSRLLLAGGFSRNPLFPILRASLAKVSRKDIAVYEVEEKDMGCLGAALCGACAAGIFKNIVNASKSMTPHISFIQGSLELGEHLIEIRKTI